MKKNSLLIAIFPALLALVMAAPSVFASSDNAKDKDEEAQVTLCHYPPGSPDNPQTLTVGASAVDAHLSQHGDTLGACPEEDKDDESKDKDDESKDDGSKDDGSKDDEAKDDSSKDDGEGKTTICHDGTNTLSVDDSAVAGHLGHGDYLGECTCACPPGAASCICADGKDGVTSPAVLTPPASQRDIRGQ